MGDKRSLAIVLAAGEGTRMRSALPKVLHRVAGRSLLGHVASAVVQADFSAVAVVIGPDHDPVKAELQRIAPEAGVYVQRERLGTAHAVLAAEAAIAGGFDEIVVLFGDTPLVRPATLRRLRAAIGGDVAVAVLGFRPADPAGYGRLIIENGNLLAIREDRDATPAEREVRLCNAGLMALNGEMALRILRQIGNDNAKREFYLTDAVAVVAAAGFRAVALEAEEDEVRGINDRGQLAEVEAALQQRLRRQALDAGATLVAPETVFFSADTQLARDVTVEPYVVFGPGVTVEEGAVIHAFSHLEGAHVGKHASVGPFARIRPGTYLAESVKVGNFVELKGTRMEAGAKANHLSYIGDTHVGVAANIGAGTITCNYDGFAKHRTEIGAGVFVGSNSALVAPVKLGEGSYIGSGSVITSDVPPGALAIGRGRQAVKEGWAQKLRARFTRDRKTAAE